EDPANFALMAIPSSSSFDNEVVTSGRYHAIPPPITGNFMPPKPDLVFNTALLAVESDHLAFNVQVSPAKPAQIMSHTTESMAPIIKDWVSDSEDESKPNNLQSVSVQPIKIPILAATPKPTIKTSSSGKRKNRKTCFVCRSVDHLIKDCKFHVKPQTKPTPRNSAHRGCNKQYASFTKKYPQKHKVHAVLLPKSKPVSITAIRQVSVAVPKIMKSRPRHAHPLNKKSNPSIKSERKPRKGQNRIKTGQKREAWQSREKFETVAVGERKPRKGQNRIKTGQKREAWRSQEKFKAVAVDKRRKTEQNAKRMAENANTSQKLFKL
nr:hypothetical protein [Tanacetum cinerariifolium]